MIGHNSGNAGLGNPGNWIALSRDVREHPIVGAGQPVRPHDPKRGAWSRMEAWFDLLCLAQFRPARVNNKGEVQTLDVGQLMGARTYLAARWNWSEKTVRGYLDALEQDGMISRGAENTLEKGHQKGRLGANKCSIITISNYSRYQVYVDAINEYVGQAKGPARGQQGATEGPPKGHNLTRKQINNTPPTPSGGDLPLASGRRKRGLTAAQISLTDAAFDHWNETAQRLGFAQVSARTDARRTRLAKRLDDIGGLDRFRIALSAIERVPFLMGKVAPKPGQAPFKLDIDRLLQTDGGLGDVLADLIDKASDASDPREALRGPNGEHWGWWRGKEETLRSVPIDRWRAAIEALKPNGTWPWWKLAAPPGDAECLVPAELVSEYGFVEIYHGQITHP